MTRRRSRLACLVIFPALALWLGIFSGQAGCASTPPPVSNPYPALEDTGRRVNFTYFFRRAWVEFTRDLATTELPAVEPLDFGALAREDFAVAWIGHATQLVRVAGKWILIDPALGNYVGPVDFFGPRRLRV